MVRRRDLGSVIVTGGAGFIGGALCEALLASDAHDVLVVDSFTYAADRSRLAAINDPRFSIAELDIRDRDAMGDLLQTSRATTVLHLAAESHVDRSIDGPRIFLETNIMGTANLLDACRDAWANDHGSSEYLFVHVSTDEVFGSAAPQRSFGPTSRYDPHSPYAASKAASDHLARAWWHTYGLPVVTTNSTNNYGPYQFPEKLIPHTVIRALMGRPLPVYGDGLHERDWIHVTDHAQALKAAAICGKAGDTYLIGARNPLPNVTLIEGICELLDEVAPAESPRREMITFVPDRPGHDRRYAIDPSKAESALGWEAQVPLPQGLRDTITWYIDNRAWWEGILQDGYEAARLGDPT